MGAKLVAYECVPSGFEMVIDNNQVKAWNLWWNTNLTDDPEAWDKEVKLINRMQKRLGTLSEDHRLIRAQIAELCRYSPAFPGSMGILCAEIGESRFGNPLKMGCEGRGLLDTLIGQHHVSKWKEALKHYSIALTKWQDQAPTENAAESRVFGLLGGLTEKKVELAGRLESVLADEEPSVESLMILAKELHAKVHGNMEMPKGRPFNCFNCEAAAVKKGSSPECHCCYGMFADALLMTIASAGGNEAASRGFRQFIQESVLVYSHALNSWLQGEESTVASQPWDTHCFSTEIATRTAEGACASLGERDGSKEWLAACLLKTLTSNQRWHKTEEMIDHHPEVRSWFARLSTE